MSKQFSKQAQTKQRFAFIKATWHGDIVDQALVGFEQLIPTQQTDILQVPGALEMPLVAKDLANTGKYDAIICAALVVDGGIYRHEFVAQAVLDGIMRVGLDTNVPVLSVSLTPHNYQPTDFHHGIFHKHFVEKGREAAQAALAVVETRQTIASI